MERDCYHIIAHLMSTLIDFLKISILPQLPTIYVELWKCGPQRFPCYLNSQLLHFIAALMEIVICVGNKSVLYAKMTLENLHQIRNLQTQVKLLRSEIDGSNVCEYPVNP